MWLEILRRDFPGPPAQPLFEAGSFPSWYLNRLVSHFSFPSPLKLAPQFFMRALVVLPAYTLYSIFCTQYSFQNQSRSLRVKGWLCHSPPKIPAFILFFPVESASFHLYIYIYFFCPHNAFKQNLCLKACGILIVFIRIIYSFWSRSWLMHCILYVIVDHYIWFWHATEPQLIQQQMLISRANSRW